MKRITLSLLMLLAVVLAACIPATPSPVPTTVPQDTATPVVLETATAAETATTEATTETPTAAATEVTVGDGLTVSTSNNAGVSQPFLVDNEGRALYVYTQDTQNSGTSACTGDCIVNWPAVIVSGTPIAGEGVDSAMLGTITRDDGTTQVTYNGWPLYYYTGDAAPGDITGQGMNDFWYLVSTAGTSIQQ